jgi:N utilization substance protein B
MQIINQDEILMSINKDTSRKTSRRSARVLMLQSLYHYQINPLSIDSILGYLDDIYADTEKYGFFLKIVPDMQFVSQNLPYSINNFNTMLELYRDFSFRPIDKINYVEKAILVIAATELFTDKTDVKVIINEAIEIAKSYGGSDSYIFINSILHKLSMKARG